MNFELSEMHIAIADTARAVGTKLATRAEAIEAAGEIPGDVLAELGELSMFGVTASEDVGGVGSDALAYALVVEALAGGSPSVARVVAVHAGPGVAALSEAGLMGPEHASGETLISYGSAASDSSIAPVTDGPYVAGGSVYAKATGRMVETLGHRASGLGEVTPNGDAIAEVDGARTRAWHDLGLAALALGSGSAAYRAGVAYALERKQFKQPIARFQAIQWKIADSTVGLDAARLLIVRAATSLDPREAAMARVMASRAAWRAADEALQIHGGYGYTEDYPVERQLRSVRMCASDDGHLVTIGGGL